ncbi:MAG: metal ABC transporter permease [bacterium]|nr:metal ABC transporter permease [bacterium]MCP5066186.1 metal ABC transporter permease [bacterium]
MLELAFMQRALVAAVGVGVVCGGLGFFVVLRGLAFAGVGISHAAIGGIAIGLLLDVSPEWSGAVFAIATALAIAWTRRRSQLSQDTVIGVFFTGAMALGLVLVSLRRSAQQDLFGYLFGNVLAISSIELLALLGLGGAVLIILALTFREHLFIAFDDEIASAYGHPVAKLEVLLLVLLAITVVLGVRLVGVLLIEALLVVPAATAALWARDYRGQVTLAMGLGATSGVAGLVFAYQLDLAAGASIALATVVLFLISLPLQRSGSD